MKYQSILALSLTSLLAVPAFADWNLIEDFEGDPQNPDYTYLVTLGNRESPNFVYEEDPTDASNTVFVCDPTTYGTEWTVTYMNWVLDTPIADGTTGTLYFRVYGIANDSLPIVVGLSDVEPEFTDGVPTQPTGFDSYGPQARIFPTLEPRDGGNYATTTAINTYQDWYHVWMVIDNANDETTFYVQGPNDTAPVHVPIPDGAGGTFDTAIFRRDAGDLIGLMYSTNANNPTSPYTGTLSYSDDYYIDPNGQNLTIPTSSTAKGPGIFSDYDLLPGNWVDTGDYMGSVWLDYYPTIWINRLQNWGYVSEGDGDPSTGKWVYIYKQ